MHSFTLKIYHPTDHYLKWDKSIFGHHFDSVGSNQSQLVWSYSAKWAKGRSGILIKDRYGIKKLIANKWRISNVLVGTFVLQHQFFIFFTWQWFDCHFTIKRIWITSSKATTKHNNSNNNKRMETQRRS